MVKRIGKILILIFLLSFLVLLQFSFVTALPDPFRQLNLVLVALIFILFFLDWRVALLSGLIIGFWLDVLSFHFFGLYLIIFLSTLLLAQGILKNWLTNRSFYTLIALMVFSTIFYNLLLAIVLYLTSANYNTIFFMQTRFWMTVLYQCVWSFLAALVLFNLATLGSKRIKPFFLEKKSYI